MSFDAKLNVSGAVKASAQTAAASIIFDESHLLNKKPEASLTADVIQRGKIQERQRLCAEYDSPDLNIPDLKIRSIRLRASAAAGLLREKISLSRDPFWNGLAIFLVVYVIGFVGVFSTLDLYPDFVHLLLGPKGAS